MKTTKETHYVYKITNLNPIDEQQFYIGVHSDKNPDSLNDDYMGSSKYLDEAMKDQGKENFKKEILSTWATREEAMSEEIRLHEINDVAKNQLFYNRSKATSTGFNTYGATMSDSSKLKRYNTVSSDEWKSKIGISAVAQMVKTRKENNSFLSGGKICSETKLSNAWKLKIGNNTIAKYKNTVSSLEWKQSIGKQKIIAFKLSMLEVVSKEKTRGDIRNQRDSKTKLSNEWKLKIGNTSSKRMSETRIKNKLAKGSNNPNAKIIKIFNSNNELKFECIGNFGATCVDNNLPFISFKKSYQQNIPLYDSTVSKKRVKNTPNEKYIGWYAILG